MSYRVYFVKSKDQVGLIKIGHCKDITNRLANLQTGTGHQLQLMCSVPCFGKDEAIALEKELHELFGYCRRRGEWFTPNRPLRDTIAYLALGHSWAETKEFAHQEVKSKWRDYKTGLRCKQLRENNPIREPASEYQEYV